MKISVAHSTVYRFEHAVDLEPHTIRLRPRDDGSQKLLCYDLRIQPDPVRRAEGTDQDGNVVTHAWFQEPARSLEVQSRFTVETLLENPFDFLLSEKAMATLPLKYPQAVRPVLAPYCNGEGAGAVIEFARAAADAAGGRTIDFLVELNRRIRSGFDPVDRTEGPARSAAETLDAGEGACRDFAVLFCSACRVMGLAARFVSGYECEAARDHAHAYMHAWAEVYLPGGGWRGFDPSRGLAVSTSHVPVAAAIEPALAAPISGSYRGVAQSAMETSIRMEASE
ncbi:MAG TPA: transglutaminase family protein [Bryobacteraceae bacterium]|nr:transglutaminase family protein [Bryobacteraceae bacterium]